ncbi:MAG: LytTR family transcriptional regulator [Candidatus Kapabacteria bacterium]|nr:LytTR family transcriptional regulator [Candidatus Kapabacteria bacterium]
MYYVTSMTSPILASEVTFTFMSGTLMVSIRTICVASRTTRHTLDDLLQHMPQCEVIAWVEPDAQEAAAEALRPDLVLVAPSAESGVREPHVAYVSQRRDVRLDDQFIAFPSQDSILLFPADSIVRLRGEGSYVRIFFSDRSDLLVAKTVGDCERALPRERFVRVHRSHIVNIRHIRRMNRGRPLRLHLSNRDEVEVSDRYRTVLIQQLPEPVRSKPSK